MLSLPVFSHRSLRGLVCALPRLPAPDKQRELGGNWVHGRNYINFFGIGFCVDEENRGQLRTRDGTRFDDNTTRRIRRLSCTEDVAVLTNFVDFPDLDNDDEEPTTHECEA